MKISVVSSLISSSPPSNGRSLLGDVVWISLKSIPALNPDLFFFFSPLSLSLSLYFLSLSLIFLSRRNIPPLPCYIRGLFSNAIIRLKFNSYLRTFPAPLPVAPSFILLPNPLLNLPLFHPEHSFHKKNRTRCPQSAVISEWLNSRNEWRDDRWTSRRKWLDEYIYLHAYIQEYFPTFYQTDKKWFRKTYLG